MIDARKRKMNIASLIEISLVQSAFFCCPKCGEEIFIFNEKLTYSDQSVKLQIVYICNLCDCRWIFASGTDRIDAVKLILDGKSTLSLG